MNVPARVADPADPRLADYRDLTDVALRRRVEPAGGLFIAEGEPVVRRALRHGYRLRSLLLAEQTTPAADDLGAVVAAAGVPVYRAGADALTALTGFHVHRGVLASVVRPPLRAAGELAAAAARLLVLEDLNNPTNLGAVFRSAAALGMDAVLLSPSCADPLYRRAVRVSMGEVFALPYARAERWPRALTDLRAAGLSLLALTPDPSAAPLDRVAADRSVVDGRLALLLGAEGGGLSPGALAEADHRVRIPMTRDVDSLNVAAAAAVACYAVGRRPFQAEPPRRAESTVIAR